MYSTHPTTGKISGILIDFDLATLRDDPPSITHGRTGTIPFMALDLANPDAFNGNIEHLYRHDFEAACWVLFWITEGFENGKALEVHPLRSWASTTCEDPRTERFLYTYDTLDKGDVELVRGRATRSHQSHAELNLLLWQFHEQILKPQPKRSIFVEEREFEKYRKLQQLSRAEQFKLLQGKVLDARSAAEGEIKNIEAVYCSDACC